MLDSTHNTTKRTLDTPNKTNRLNLHFELEQQAINIFQEG